MPRATDARNKALRTAERLFRTQGYAATGLAQIIAESGSPKGSFYFHFPGGKDQLATETVEGFAASARNAIAQIAERVPGDAVGFVHMLCGVLAAEMRATGYVLGCVLQNVATEKAPGDREFTFLLEAGFDSWISVIADHFSNCGVPDAHDSALALVAALEGARTLARVQRSDAVFAAIAESFATALKS